MPLDKLRYLLTGHTEKYFFTCENFRLLIHPSVTSYNDLLNQIKDDISLMPELEKTSDNIDIKFYEFDYKEEIYSKSELLAFIFSSISKSWDIVKGIDLSTGKIHFWLKHGHVIYDPSLAVVTNEDIYSKRFRQLKKIRNEDTRQYLIKNNNLFKFYNNFFNKNSICSIKFIDNIVAEFNKNIVREYSLDKARTKEIRQHFMINEFIELRQVLSQKRKSYLQSSNIAVHPYVNDSILETIKKRARQISDLMQKEYSMYFDYFDNTLGNCYGLSIMVNLFDESFKLVQGGIPYQRCGFNTITNYFYQHSWLERKDIVYDPALRVITPKDLYYIFVQKQDEYSKEETENILLRIGFNLTHFRDFMKGRQIGNDETIGYRSLVNKIDSPEMREEGKKLLSLVKKYNN